jgi:hypothetical protein
MGKLPQRRCGLAPYVIYIGAPMEKSIKSGYSKMHLENAMDNKFTS